MDSWDRVEAHGDSCIECIQLTKRRYHGHWIVGDKDVRRLDGIMDIVVDDDDEGTGWIFEYVSTVAVPAGDVNCMLIKYKLTATHILNRSSLYYRISTGKSSWCDNHIINWRQFEGRSIIEICIDDENEVLSERLISMAKDEVRNSMMGLWDIKSMWRLLVLHRV